MGSENNPNNISDISNNSDDSKGSSTSSSSLSSASSSLKRDRNQYEKEREKGKKSPKLKNSQKKLKKSEPDDNDEKAGNIVFSTRNSELLRPPKRKFYRPGDSILRHKGDLGSGQRVTWADTDQVTTLINTSDNSYLQKDVYIL